MTATVLDVFNPADGQRIAQLPADDAASVARKAQAARAAQPAWAAVPLAERIAAIARFRQAVVVQTESLAAVMTRETGKPIRLSRNELNGLLPRLDFFIAEAQAALATEAVFHDGSMREEIEHRPLGLVANISAWNYPWFVGCNVLVPALLAGNAVLYKPSEHAAMTGLEIGRLLHAAGVPERVLTTLVGGGDVGAALLAQDIDGLFFTGSHATGQRIAQALAGRFHVRLQLELGGKDPAYVCEDADPRAAAESLADGAMYNTGQSCCSVERIYVHEKVHDAFVAAFVEQVRGMKAGPTMSEESYIGPLTRQPQLAVLEAQCADALAQGAQLLVGGRRVEGPGHWFAPTVFSHVNHGMQLMREESFGPVIGIQKVAGDEEAVRLMNDSRYGLTAGVYTPDAARARRLLAQLQAGSLYWNCCDRVSPRLPWSGVKDSGVGLTLSREGIRTFTRPAAWHLRQA